MNVESAGMADSGNSMGGSIPESRMSRGGCDSPVVAGGRFLRLGANKWRLRGVTYGPFAPRGDGMPWPESERMEADLNLIRDLGFNTLRCYEVPSDDLLKGCRRRGLRLLVGIPWAQHLDFLSERRWARDAERRVDEVVGRLAGDPAVLGYLVGNEIPADLVRWIGPRRVERFLEQLIGRAKRLAGAALVSYATYPSTEYLQPGGADFLAVNLYLEDRDALDAYLRRLQIGAGDLPLVLSEFGIDSLSGGELAQAEAVEWLEEAARNQAVAGTVWFSFTDEWHRGGQDVTGWGFGLVTRDRETRPAAERSRAVHRCRGGGRDEWLLPAASDVDWPRMSIIVCSLNGQATLPSAIESLLELDYPDFEIIVVDDGSSVSLESLAGAYGDDRVRFVRQSRGGLGRARNTGAAHARGTVLVFMDDDCRADRHWLRYLALALMDRGLSAVGGPNIPPPSRGATERRVAAAPGGPSHVMLDDWRAEHLPGCNLAVRRDAFEAVGGFRERYWVAGDDVDFCWRLEDAGGRLGFSPAAMVWHHRRMTVAAYLRQQVGYGRAEALLALEHPRRFRNFRAQWRGTVYGGERAHSVASVWRPRVYHGLFGAGPYQRLAGGSWPLWPCQGLGSLGLAGMFGLMAWWIHPWFLLGLAGQLGWSFWHAWRQAKRRAHDGSGFGFVDRFHVMILAWAQPVVRDWARIRGLVFGVRWNSLAQRNPAALGRLIPAGAAIRRQWWLEEWRDPLAEMATAVESAGGRVTGMSDPCSREDLSWDRVNWWAGAAAHVLEWHSDGTAVLRLKIRGWVSAKSLAPAAVVVAGAILLWMEGGLGRLGLGLAMAGGFVTAWLPAWLGRGRVARAMDAAAQRLGWRRIG